MKLTNALLILAMALGGLGVSTPAPAVAAETVTLATLEWEPYIGPNMPEQGYVHEIVVQAFKRGGYKAEVQTLPWARAVAMAEGGKVDGLFPEYYDESRKEKFVFSEEFPGGPVGLYKRKDNPLTYAADPRLKQKEALQGLKELKIGVVRGYVNTAEFDAATYLQKEEVSEDELNLKKLFNKRLPLIFIDKFVAQHLIKSKFPEYAAELEFMEPPLEVKNLYICFAKAAPNYEEKINKFNEGLRAMKKDGSLAEILKKHGFQGSEK